jgi:hypothetical protein
VGANPGNVTTLKDSACNQLSQNVTAFVFDLFGNTLVRFEQFDGSMALPSKAMEITPLVVMLLQAPPKSSKKLWKQNCQCWQSKETPPV